MTSADEKIFGIIILALLLVLFFSARPGEDSALALKECQEAVAAIEQQNDWLRLDEADTLTQDDKEE
jgi:cell division protein FtsB